MDVCDDHTGQCDTSKTNVTAAQAVALILGNQQSCPSELEVEVAIHEWLLMLHNDLSNARIFKQQDEANASFCLVIVFINNYSTVQ